VAAIADGPAKPKVWLSGVEARWLSQAAGMGVAESKHGG